MRLGPRALAVLDPGVSLPSIALSRNTRWLLWRAPPATVGFPPHASPCMTERMSSCAPRGAAPKSSRAAGHPSTSSSTRRRCKVTGAPPLSCPARQADSGRKGVLQTLLSPHFKDLHALTSRDIQCEGGLDLQRRPWQGPCLVTSQPGPNFLRL